MKPHFAIIALFCALFPVSAHAWPGTVLSVGDGDTVTVAPGGDASSPIAVRLYGIDAPEKKQAFGAKAKAYLTEHLPVGQTVEVLPFDMDQYGRSVALVQTDGRTVNAEMVREGYAWVYTRYCKAKMCHQWKKDEKAAREANLGLWQEEEPTPPWVWRKEHSRR